MSRTSKFTLAAALALAAVAAPALSQEKDDAAMLSALMQGMGGDAASSSDIGTEIESRIRSLMSEMGSASGHKASAPITIEEIDGINRSAERERTALEFEKARFERAQLEIERLLALYEAARTIEEDKREQAQERQERLMEMMQQVGSDDDVDPRAASVGQDQKNLPRIDSISGVGGVYTADADFSGETEKTLRIGERTLNGFMVEEIQPSFVVLRGPSSNQLFRLVPKAPKPQAPMSPMGPGGVIDLSQFPMAQF